MITMRKWVLGLAALALLATGFAIAQPGQIFTSPIAVAGSFPYNGGPQVSAVKANGATTTCTNGGTITVANTNVTANSLILLTLKTVGGTPAQPFLATITVGTGFTYTCGGSDSSVYNYLVLG